MNLDRFSRPMPWEYDHRKDEIDELEEYKRIRDMELDADDKSSNGNGHESSNRSR